MPNSIRTMHPFPRIEGHFRIRRQCGCGELLSRAAKDCIKTGSSPRVRGTRAGVSWRNRSYGFIPACAGNSPLGANREFRQRFIPACAGNSRQAPVFRCQSSVHPRVCGELGLIQIASGGIVGSSPRVRGTPWRNSLARAIDRFIPACAGNSLYADSVNGNNAVHPRVCGELLTINREDRTLNGSSPRVRGSSTSAVFAASSAAVHPRVCGELLWLACVAATMYGSSPRVRGTLRQSRWSQISGGSSPRVRGTPCERGYKGRYGAVHPRVCGELWRLIFF